MNSIPGGASKTKAPLAGAFVLEMVLPQSKRRFSAGSMRADSGMNEAPVGLQSRIVTEPAGEKRLQKKPQKPQCFGAFFYPALCSFAKLDTKWTQLQKAYHIAELDFHGLTANIFP